MKRGLLLSPFHWSRNSDDIGTKVKEMDESSNQTSLRAYTRRYLVYALILSIVCVSISSCYYNKLKAQEVILDRLFTSPDQYHGKKVVTEGFFFHGWEVIVLCESLEYSGYAEEHLVPAGRVIWVEGEIPQDVYDGLNEQQMLGPEERFGFVRVIGKFEFGGQYGHNGGYDSQIIPFKIELLNAPS